RCSVCSTPAPPASPSSTSTTGAAPPPPRAASITREGAPRGHLGRARPRRARPGRRDPGRPEREPLGAGRGAGRLSRGDRVGAGTAGAGVAGRGAARPAVRFRAYPGPAAPGARGSGGLGLEGIAKAGVVLAQQFTQRGAAIVLQGIGPASGTLRIVAVSTAADSRLQGLVLPPAAPAVRATTSAVPVVSRGAEDIFGSALPDRRRQDRAGTAYPLFDGHFVIGALVVMGPQLPAGSPVADHLQRLIAELGSRLPAARAVFEAEQRAVSDPLTGLRNRRELERALTQHGSKAPPIATLV